MYHDPYIGAAAAAQRKRVLILGESHHGDGPEDVGKSVEIKAKGTKDVVEDYLSQTEKTEQRLQFFHKIALSFGIDTGKDEERKLFWDKVFFVNYITDVLCGVKDDTAKNLAKRNKETYNRELAEFVNLYQIDTIFSFGLPNVFDHLPGNHYAGILPGEDGEKIDGKKFGKNKELEIAGYLCEWELFDHPVHIYGMTHPSVEPYRHFLPELFAEYLKPVFEDCCG